ncbi:MAG: SDR family oxidoreductase [Acidimicrobiales bacterium]|jgi:7-alpha-hydroxysteroid dehydrogenase
MMLDRFRMDDKVAIVTGAGRGIGAATAIGLAEAGADVVISSRTVDQLDAVAAQIEAAGRKVVAVPANLNDLDAVASLVDRARDSFGRLDLVVNNVGGTMPQSFMDTTAKVMEDAFHFNVATAHALLHAAVPLMLEDGGGSAVNISSAMGRLAGRGFVAYGTAKAALAHYTRLSAMDLAPRIRVNAIAVGSVATSALDIVMQIDEMRTAMEDATPLHRIGDPADIAAAVVYLASDAGSYITGKIIEVDGGTEAPTLDLGIPDV